MEEFWKQNEEREVIEHDLEEKEILKDADDMLYALNLSI